MDELRLHGLIGGGSNIKSLQHGEASIPYDAKLLNITIQNVDVNKSIVRVFGGGQSNQVNSDITIKLKDATTITIERLSANATTCTFYFEVIEFVSVKSLQKGTKSFATSSTNVTIAKVNTSKSLVFFSTRLEVNTSLTYEKYFYAHLINDTTLELKNLLNTIDRLVEWQVIEFN